MFIQSMCGDPDLVGGYIMNWILVGISVVVAAILWYLIPPSILEKRKAILLLLILITAAGSILFQSYEYAILQIVRYLILMAAMVLISSIDKRKMIIPNRILFILLGLRCLVLMGECILNWSTATLEELLLPPFLGMLLGGGLFFFCYFITRKGIGAGDVKLFAVIGFYVGPGVLFPIMLLAALLSAIYGGVMVLLRKLKLCDSIPFGPFAAIGTIVTLLMGF